ncbi:MAG: LD-carboxypeptidase [Erysipelotrichaceae bacterium]|nr:LD-carboxypeptidase [Erysipelotrichaceae bacterium]
MNKVAFVACSNGQTDKDVENIIALKKLLNSMNIEVIESDCLYGYASGKDKADAMNHFYEDNSIDAIFDLSGGDLANTVLPYLDYDLIANSDKLFFGYSDLTTVINAIYAKTEKSSILFQIKNLVKDDTGIQIERFKKYLQGQNDLIDVKWNTLQGQETINNQIIVGGNTRCFLKLAGTKYMPDLHHKLLFLEALSGNVTQISTYLAQLDQIGAFQQVDGILLGTFTQMEKQYLKPTVYEMLQQYINKDMFVAQTSEVGHSKTSKALRIG